MPGTLRIITAILIVQFCGLTAFAQESIPWAPTLEQAKAEAARQNKIVLVHFWSQHCGPCLKLDRYVFNKAIVGQAVAENCIPVKVNTIENPQLAKQFGIRSIPQDVFITPDGFEISRGVSPQHDQAYIQMVRRVASTAKLAPRNPNMELARTAQRQRAFEAQPTSYPPQTGVPGQTGVPPQNGAPQQTRVPQQNGSAYGQPAPGGPITASPGGGDFMPANSPNNRSQMIVNPQFGQPNPQNANPPVPNRTNQPLNYPHNPRLPARADPSGAFKPNAAFGNPPPSVGNRQATGGPGPVRPPNNAFQPGPNAGAPNIQQQPTNVQAQRQPAPVQPHAGAFPLGMDGYCPVTLAQSKDHRNAWKRGDPRWGAHHRGRTYLFAGPEQQKEFLANPDFFSPALSCYDPVHFAETKELLEGKREHGLTYHAQVFLFANEASLQEFSKRPEHYKTVVREAMRANTNGHQRR